MRAGNKASLTSRGDVVNVVVFRKCCKAFSGLFEKLPTTAEPQTNGGKNPLVKHSIQRQESKETSPIKYPCYVGVLHPAQQESGEPTFPSRYLSPLFLIRPPAGSPMCLQRHVGHHAPAKARQDRCQRSVKRWSPTSGFTEMALFKQRPQDSATACWQPLESLSQLS